MRKIILFLILSFSFLPWLYAAPCYGTKMPEKRKFIGGLQSHAIFKRYLEKEAGKMRSSQHFLLLSFGIYDWLCLDLKGGAGNIKQHPLDSNEVDYTSGFSGGYGLRLKIYEDQKLKVVFGFQHISAHCRKTYLGNVKHRAVLDDWQISFLASYDFLKITPYLGTKWSRTDYIHWTDDERKRNMSDLSKALGLVLGLDLPFNDKIWLNLEGQFFDVEAMALSLNFSF